MHAHEERERGEGEAEESEGEREGERDLINIVFRGGEACVDHECSDSISMRYTHHIGIWEALQYTSCETRKGEREGERVD